MVRDYSVFLCGGARVYPVQVVEPDAIKEIEAMLTTVDGRIVFDREQGQAGQAVQRVRTMGPLSEGCDCAETDHLS